MRIKHKTCINIKLNFLFLLMLTISLAAQENGNKIEELVKKYYEIDQFNGTVLVADKDKIIYKGGFGPANIEFDIPNEPAIKFRLGSITKQFTSFIIMKLVEEGKLSLESKLSDLLPYYRKDVGEQVTLHQLLVHSSGIPSYTGLPGFFAEVSRKFYEVEDFVTSYCSNDLEFEPGSEFRYNNSGYFILGAIIENVTGQTYETALKEFILNPLDMQNTGYDTHEAIIEKRASGYERGFGGFTNSPFLDMSLPYAAGSMYSTVEDLYKWDRSLYSDKLLSSPMKEKMFAPHIKDNSGYYAYGWGVRKKFIKSLEDSITVIQHGGGINGFNTIILRIPEHRYLIVLLNNTSQAPLNQIATGITNILYGSEADIPQKSIAKHIYEIIDKNGIVSGIESYKKLKDKEMDSYVFAESELNNLGYELLNRKKMDEAIEIFKLNIEEYPEAFNTYDSMGEAFMEKGDYEQAIEYYKKSIELNPRNFAAYDKLEEMGVELEQPTDPEIESSILENYVGRYQLAPNFILEITTETEKIYAQATGQAKFEIFPESENVFYLKVVEAKIEFVQGDNGEINSLILYQNGQEMPAEKIR